MSLSLGELVGYIRGDDSQFIRTLDESDRRMASFQTGTNGRLRRMEGEFGAHGQAMGRALGGGLEEALSSLHPEVRVDADSRPADEAVAELYRRLEALRDAEIGVDIPTDHALRELDEIHAALTNLAATSPDVNVQANTASALFSLDLLRGVIDEVDAAHPEVDVDVNATRAEEELRRVDDAARRVGNNDGARTQASKMGGLTSAVSAVGSVLTSLPFMISAGIPAAAGLAAALVNVAPAAAIGATAILAMAQATAAIKIGTSGVGAAITAAFAPAAGGASAAANSARQYADAQRALKDAISQAAYANQQAVQQVASAERSLTTAQLAARQAQLDLTQARKDATRQLQDQNNSLADAQLAQRQAVLDVSAAEKNLAAVKAQGTAATKDQIDAAQLQYDQATQSLTEQNLAVDRLSTDTAAANKAGVEGSKTVTDAKKQVSSANQTVSDQERALADARTQQARTAAQGLESIQKAQEALTQATAASAGGVNALAAAMAKLSPNARAFVQQVIALKPAWDALKISVQDALFQGLAGTLKTTAASVMPVLKRELTNTASALNDMAKGAMGAAKNLADSGVLGQAMHSASTGLHNLSGIPGIVVTAFGQLAAAAGPSFVKLTSAVGGVAADIGKKLGSAFKSGAMQSAIETAVGLIKEIGQIAGNVFSVIGSVMKATAQTGGGFLGALVTISSTLKTTFASPDVQAGLRAIFSTMEVLAKTVAPLLNEAIKGIAPVFTALGPPVQRLITALGAALSPIIAALGPVLEMAAVAVGSLLDAVSPLLPIIGQLIASIGPVLALILDTLAVRFQQIAPLVAALGQVLMQLLAPILAQLPTIITPLMAVFNTLAGALLPVLTQLIMAIAPSIGQLAQAFGQVLVALAPVIAQFAVLYGQYLQTMVPLLTPIIGLVGKLASFLADKLAAYLTTVVVPALNAVTALLHGDFSGAFDWAKKAVMGWANIVVDLLIKLPARMGSALAPLAGRLWDKAWAAGSQLVSAIQQKLGDAINWVKGLPGRVRDALGNLGGYLYNSGRSLISGFIDGLKSMASTAGNAAGDLLTTVRNYFPFSPAKKGPFSGQGWVDRSGMAMAMAVAGGLRSGEGAVSAAALSLMGTAHRGLTGAGTPMGNLVSNPGAGGLAGAGGRAGGSSGAGGQTLTVRNVIDVTGADADMVKMIRSWVKNTGGGDVQKVFGY